MNGSIVTEKFYGSDRWILVDFFRVNCKRERETWCREFPEPRRNGCSLYMGSSDGHLNVTTVKKGVNAREERKEAYQGPNSVLTKVQRSLRPLFLNESSH